MVQGGDIPMVCVREILNNLHPYYSGCIDKTQALRSTNIIRNAVVRIQGWYRRYRLKEDAPPEYTTLRVLKRFYVVKYKKLWLMELPFRMIRKLHLRGVHTGKYLNYTDDMIRSPVRTFYQFCEDFNVTTDNLNVYGW